MGPEITGLVALGLALGLRHGIDWDHIAAITDIAGFSANREPARAAVSVHGHAHAGEPQLTRQESAYPVPVGEGARNGFTLATLYAAGHATLVGALGLLAIWASTVLPEWVDPLMERVVGATLLLLGGWILYSLSRSGRDLQLRSRWMLVFALATHAWAWVRSKITGRPVPHRHEIRGYGAKTAFSIGMIHGIGAETGSQALLLAAAAGATSALQGTLMLASFTVGLLISNMAVAAVTVCSFVSSSAKRNISAAIAVVAAVSSLIVGLYFVTGNANALPDLQRVLETVFGAGLEI